MIGMAVLNPPSEVELKFDVARQDLEGLLASPLWRNQPPIGLTSTYFDTDDQLLLRAGLSLRLRAGVQTLKASRPDMSGLFERSEWEHEVPGPHLDLTRLTNTPLADLGLRAEQLRAVVSIFVERRIAMVRTAPDSLVEVALDIGHIETGGRTLDFYELELERVEGPTRALFDLALSMANETRLVASFQSKADRGFAWLANQPAIALKAESRLDLSGLTVGQALRAMVREGLRHILHNGAMVRQERDVEALHQIRVALRRLRSALGLFRSVAADDGFVDMRARLRSLSQLMGKARDLDVLIARLEASAVPSPRLLDALIQDRSAAYDAVCRVLNSHAYGQAILTVMAWAETGDWLGSSWPQAELRDRPVLVFANAALERLRRKIKKEGEDLSTLAPEAQHRVRIRAKNLRYAMELFGSLYPDQIPARQDLIEAVKQVQDRLGVMNDRVVGEQLLRAHDRGPAAFDAGQALSQLYAQQENASAQAEQALRKALDLPRFWRKP
ncbi:MAG: hypothetical protein RLZZ141_492 [Pseudomonadota bacterium]